MKIGLEYNLDNTNLNTDITRNFLRHKILPKFEKINDNYKNNLNNLITYFDELKTILIMK